MNLITRIAALCSTIGGFHQALDAQTIVRAMALPEVATAPVTPPTSSSGFSQTFGTVDQLQQYPAEIDLIVFPNPASEAITIQSSIPAEGFVQGASLVNYLGQIVESAIPHTSSAVVIGVSHLPEGFYHLIVLTANGIVARKVEII